MRHVVFVVLIFCIFWNTKSTTWIKFETADEATLTLPVCQLTIHHSNEILVQIFKKGAGHLTKTKF